MLWSPTTLTPSHSASPIGASIRGPKARWSGLSPLAQGLESGKGWQAASALLLLAVLYSSPVGLNEGQILPLPAFTALPSRLYHSLINYKPAWDVGICRVPARHLQPRHQEDRGSLNTGLPSGPPRSATRQLPWIGSSGQQELLFRQGLPQI